MADKAPYRSASTCSDDLLRRIVQAVDRAAASDTSYADFAAFVDSAGRTFEIQEPPVRQVACFQGLLNDARSARLESMQQAYVEHSEGQAAEFSAWRYLQIDSFNVSGLSVGELHALRRSLARLVHPDVIPEADRDMASNMMARINGKIDDAIKTAQSGK